MAKFPPGDLTVFLDDGGVLNESSSPLVPEQRQGKDPHSQF